MPEYRYLEAIQYIADNTRTDIADHLPTIYLEVLNMNPLPKLIVELGISQGNSTKLFSMINNEIGSRLISVDQNPCDPGKIHNGTLVVADDIEYAGVFKKEYGNIIDVLMIDTSHLYDHTKQEIASWFPLLREKALIIFHDTNLKREVRRKNGEISLYWDNERGVTRAIEEYFEIKMDEESEFEKTYSKDGSVWHFKHWPYCNGLLVISKNP